MTSRVVFSHEFLIAIQIRGLTLTELAQRANVAPATVSAAVRGRQVNVSTALRLSRTVSACKVVPELVTWVGGANERGL